MINKQSNDIHKMGSAGEGSKEWLMQRFTALILMVLSIWFVFNILTLFTVADIDEIGAWFASPINATLFIVMIIALYIHAELGIRVIIEDYIHGKKMKLFALIKNKVHCFLFAVISILSILRLHFMDIINLSLN